MGQNASYYGYALGTVQAGGHDFAIDGGVISLTGVGSFPYDNIQTQIVKQVYVAPVARVTVLTFSAPAAIGEDYNVVIAQPTTGGNTFPQTFSLGSTDTSATTIAQAFKTAFENAVANGLLFGTASGAADAITLTGTTDFPMLRVLAASAKVAISVSTAGNPAVNTGAQLIAAGIDTAVVGEEYTTFTFQNITPTGDIQEDGIFRQLVYAVEEGASNASTLIDQMSAVFAGGVSAASPEANAELIGKLA